MRREHQLETNQLRRLAAEHRAAAAALEAAERASCAGLSEYDRDISPFFHREDVVAVREVQGYALTNGKSERTPKGAVIVFRPTPGLTADSLRSMVRCHMARAASVGFVMPEMGYCPLALKGVNATVLPEREGLAVRVTADDRAVAAEIVRRGRAVAGRSSPRG